MLGAKGPLSDNWLVDSQGYLQKAVDAISLDGTMTINISGDTKILDSAGNPLTNITVTPIEPPAAAPEGYQILKSFDFTPNGAQFDPGITITISFNPSDVPSGKTVALAFYNETEGKWEFVPGINNGDGTATFAVLHFSAYSLMYQGEDTSLGIWPWIGITAALVAIAMAALLTVLLQRRRSRTWELQ